MMQLTETGKNGVIRGFWGWPRAWFSTCEDEVEILMESPEGIWVFESGVQGTSLSWRFVFGSHQDRDEI